MGFALRVGEHVGENKDDFLLSKWESELVFFRLVSMNNNEQTVVNAIVVWEMRRLVKCLQWLVLN